MRTSYFELEKSNTHGNSLWVMIPQKELTFTDLDRLIIDNPLQDKITQLWTLPKGSEEYDSYKLQFPYITPHGTFSYRSNENVQSLSGYLYFCNWKAQLHNNWKAAVHNN